MLREIERMLRVAGSMGQVQRSSLEVERKPDGTLVSHVDRDIEGYLRAEIERLEPEAGLWGEEEGLTGSLEASGWLLDPIDGTSNYVFGSPLWGVSIARMEGGKLVQGGVFLPDLDELYLAETGAGATLNGNPLAEIAPGPIEPYHLVSYDKSAVGRLGAIPGKQRYGGAFVIDGAWLLTGRLRGMVAGGECLYDAAAIIVMAREVGLQTILANGEAFDELQFAHGKRIDRDWLLFPKEASL
jgi:myo-inositol-1(or 4)-monophosphatase